MASILVEKIHFLPESPLPCAALYARFWLVCLQGMGGRCKEFFFLCFFFIFFPLVLEVKPRTLSMPAEFPTIELLP